MDFGGNGTGWTFTAGTASAAPAPLDWEEFRRQVLSALGPGGICREYERLGAKWAEPPAALPGWRACHALARKDEHASAAIHTGTGYYIDKGGNEHGSLWEMLARYGAAADWIAALRQTAEAAGVAWPSDRIRRRNDGRILTATYSYRDRHGVERYKVERFTRADGSKTFVQAAAIGDGKYRTGRGCMDGVAALPYRLPELLQADPDAPVWVCEGEKDCDRLAGLGLVATTNHRGSQSTALWITLRSWLQGRRVIVIPDNDPPGFQHALGVAGHLEGVAAAVSILPLPGLPLKGDVSDWLDRGHTAEELLELDALSPAEFRQSIQDGEVGEAAPEGDDADATAADLIRMGATTTWLWPNWLPQGVLVLLAAEAGAGKTSVCLDLTRRIALGLPWPDGAPGLGRPGKVLWVPADNQHAQLADAAQQMGFDPESLVLNATRRDPFGGTELMTPTHYDELEARIVRQKPDLVVIDTITNVSDLEVQSASDMTRLYKPLADVSRRTGTTVMCVTHANAEGKTLGRRADEKTRATISLTFPDPENDPRRRLEVTKFRVGVKPPALGISWSPGGIEYDQSPPERPDPDAPRRRGKGESSRKPSPERDRAVEFLRARLESGPDRVHTIRRAAEEQDISAKTLYAARDAGPFEEIEIEGKKWWRRTDLGGDGASVGGAASFDPDRPF